MSRLTIMGEPVAEGCSASGIGKPAGLTPSTTLTTGISSLTGLAYVITALACGIVFALLGSLLFYEVLQFAAMLLRIAL